MACTQTFYPLDKLKGNKIEKPWNSSEHQRIMPRKIEGADWEPRKQRYKEFQVVTKPAGRSDGKDG